MSKIRLKQLDEAEVSGYILDVVSGDLSSISGTLSGLTSSGSTMSGEFSNLVSMVNTLSGQNTGISGRLSTIESEFNDFETDVNNFSSVVYQLSGEIVTTNNNLTLFSGDLVAAEADIITLEADSVIASGRINTLSGNVASATGVINSDISTLSGRIDSNSGSIVVTSGKVNTLSGHFTTLSGNVNTFTGRYVNDYVMLCDASGSGVAGGSFSAGSWTTRNLNTEVSDSGNICSLSGHRITLSGGVYRCDISCPALKVGTHIARLFNVSNSSGVLTGSAEYSNSATEYAQTRSRIIGQFIVTGSTGQLFEIQHICSVGYGTYGLGAAGSVGVNVPNIYTVAEFTRISA